MNEPIKRMLRPRRLNDGDLPELNRAYLGSYLAVHLWEKIRKEASGSELAYRPTGKVRTSEIVLMDTVKLLEEFMQVMVRIEERMKEELKNSPRYNAEARVRVLRQCIDAGYLPVQHVHDLEYMEKNPRTKHRIMLKQPRDNRIVLITDSYTKRQALYVECCYLHDSYLHAYEKVAMHWMAYPGLTHHKARADHLHQCVEAFLHHENWLYQNFCRFERMGAISSRERLDDLAYEWIRFRFSPDERPTQLLGAMMRNPHYRGSSPLEVLYAARYAALSGYWTSEDNYKSPLMDQNEIIAYEQTAMERVQAL